MRNLRDSRVPQFILIASFIPLCWLGMMIVHECGYVSGAWLSGGKISKVVLHPLVISRTDLALNPRPLFVVWAGPVLGVLLPLAALGIATLVKARGVYLVRFFAGFCLMANGAYLLVGTLDRMGDPSDMLRHGSAPWRIILTGVVMAAVGLRLWHRLGPSFGLGETRGKVAPSAVAVSLALLTIVVLAELIVNSR